jgi:hypothetical protein
MLSVSLRASRTALISCLLLWGPGAVAQANPAWVDPVVRPGDIAAPNLLHHLKLLGHPFKLRGRGIVRP